MERKTKTCRPAHSGLWIALFLSAICGFLFFGIRPIQAQAECTVVYNGGTTKTPLIYPEIYPMHPIEYANGDTLTITEDGTVYNLTYYINDFYTTDWKNLADYGYGLTYQWDEDYDFGYVDEHIGEEYSYHYCLYRINEKGEPLDSEGNVAETAEDVYICAVTDPVILIAADDHIETTINGILYYVYNGADYAQIIMPKGLLQGNVILPSHVKIDGKSYPLKEIGSLNECPDMTGVTIPATVERIYTYAFANTGLKEITIPDSVQEIDEDAFGFTFNEDPETGEYVKKKVPGFIVYGSYGSEAYKYAYNNGLTFVDRKRNATAAKVKISAKALKKKKIKLTWPKQTSVSGFEVYRATKRNGKYKKVATLKKSTQRSWIKKYAKTKIGKKLFFKVRPYTTVNGSKVYGKWSNIVSIKIRK